MIKTIILMSMISLALSFTIFSSDMFSNPVADNTLPSDPQIIRKGSLITDEIQTSIKSAIEKAYIFNGDNKQKNLQFIQQQLNNTYPGIYNVGMITWNLAYKQSWGLAIPSGEWYILWKGANKYQTDYTYFVQRQNGSSTNSVCSNYEKSRFSSLFFNIAFAAYKTKTDYQNFTSEVQYWLKDYNATVNPMVFAIEPSRYYEYMFCTWNVTSYNYLRNSYYSIYSTPYIE